MTIAPRFFSPSLVPSLRASTVDGWGGAEAASAAILPVTEAGPFYLKEGTAEFLQGHAMK